ncbi:MAG: sulfite exporter TauE/SafE family protein [Gemmatimonadales bacterium]|nr:MAG: sulfite exporter TauE/SafE family protein [Gemmatimonadales bacterium]
MSLPFPAAAAILLAVGFIAGTVNVLAGGGSLLTLPVLIFLGLPPTVANGTNRVAILVQNVGASLSFRRHGLLDGRWLRLAGPPALLGAVLGIWLAVRVGDTTLQRVLAVLMVAVAVWTLWNPIKPPVHGAKAPPEGVAARTALAVGFFAVGVYGGFIQAGVGFVILALISAAGLDLVRGNAMKVTLVLLFTPLALAGFAMNGMVDWALGVSLAGGNLLGGLLGVRLNVRKGQDWIRAVVVAMVLVFAVRLWFSA